MSRLSTLLHYQLHSSVQAFSTTRISPFPLTEQEMDDMGSYAAFNVTHYCGDAPERVTRNRQWLAAQLDIMPSQLWLPRQTHTDHIACIDRAFLSLPQDEQLRALEEVDALVTDQLEQCIGVSTADCIPILLLDANNRVAAAIHAGWRGTIKHIVAKTLRLMQQRYGTSPTEVVAQLGPGISSAAYEVGEEVASLFAAPEAGFPSAVVSYPSVSSNASVSPRPHLDLQAANVFLLEEGGVPLDQIRVSPFCTFTHSDSFFSARRLGIQSGRIYSAIMMHE